jgi:hypothetical protein
MFALKQLLLQPILFGVTVSGFFFTFVFAIGFEPIHAFKISLLLLSIALLVTPNLVFTDISSNFSEFLTRIFLGLSMFSCTWVFVVSSETSITQFVLSLGLILCLYLIRRLKFRPKMMQSKHGQFDNAGSVSFVVLSAFIILVLRGWSHLVFLALPLGMLAFFFRSRNPERLRSVKSGLIQPVVFTFIIAGAWISNRLVQPLSSMYWVSYDQVFRSALATGLTRWGWKDANLGTGHSYTYHWLTEGVAGVLARVSGVSEADVISRLLPALATLFAVSVATLILSMFHLKPIMKFTVLFLFVFLEGSFELFSVGTLFGASIYLFSIFMFVIHASDHFISRLWVFSLLPFLSLISQAAMGLPLVVGIFISTILLLFKKIIVLRVAMGNIFLIGFTVFLMQQSVFRSASVLGEKSLISLDSFLRFPALRITFGTEPESSMTDVRINSLFFILLLLATYLVVFSRRPTSPAESKWQLIVGAQFLSSILLLNFFPLGNYGGKFLTPVGIVGLLSGLIALSVVASHFTKQRLTLFCSFTVVIIFLARWFFSIIADLSNNSYSLVVLSGVLLLFLVSTFGVGRIRRHGDLNQSITSLRYALPIFVIIACIFIWPRSDVFSRVKAGVNSQNSDTSFILGGADLAECLEFIRVNSPTESIVATGLWRLPSLADERYVITSLLSQRRTLVDGPTFDHINWPSRAYFEDLKNTHTEFSNSLSDSSRSKLVRLGADYFLIDTRFDNPDRTWTTLDGQNVLLENSQCSVIKLD